MSRAILLLLLVFVASCSTDKSASASAAPQARKSMSERFNGSAIKQDANGKWPAAMERYSQSDGGRTSPYFTQTSNLAKPYKAGDYAKTAWAGKTTDLPKAAYAGKTDGSRFHTPSRVSAGEAREATSAAVVHDPYQTGDFKTSAARESHAKRIDKPSDAQTDFRRRVTPEPEVTSWQEQRALDMKATKSLLGRE
jgi:hypothetical protein